MIVETRGLTKHYGGVHALEDLSLSVHEGEVFGFLGPNGAGKTTTIRLLLDLIRPSSGDFTMPPRADVGYLPGELSLWPQLTGRQTLDLLGRLSARPTARRAELCERLGLTDEQLKRRVGSYSDGMKQKLGIVQALQCEPKLMLLDEPTKGLDPLVQRAFYQIILDMRGRGATVFFSTHILTEVERICDRLAMLRGGRLVHLGTVAELKGSQSLEDVFLDFYR